MTTLDRSERLKRLSPNKRALLVDALRREAATERILRRPAGGAAPTSFAQQRLWLLDQIAPGDPAYNVPFAVRLAGRLDAAALGRSLDEIVRRHEALRTVFAPGPEGPVQVVGPASRLPLPRLDLAALPDEVREGEMRRLVREDARAPFDLGRGPLVRARLLCLAADEHVLVFGLHHVITDGWSNSILLAELGDLYAAFVRGEPSPLPDLPVQYADFAIWQRKKLAGETLDRLLAFWRRQLAGVPASLDLPADRPRPAHRTHRGGVVDLVLPARAVAAPAELGRAREATPFMVLLAAFQALLGRYAGAEDVVMGSPVAGRVRSETERVIGFFVNMLALRTGLSGDPAFAEILERVRRATLAAYDHAALPFERLVEELRPGREAAGNPLFQVVFVLQNAPRAVLSLPGLTLETLDLHSGVAKFDLTLLAEPQEDGGLRCRLEYSRELFDATTAARLLGHFANLLAAAAARPAERLSDLPLMGEAERHQVAAEWSAPAGTPSAGTAEATVHALVEARAAAAPEAPALQADGLELSYGELSRRANRLARHLRALGAAAETIVGVALERSADLVVTLLAVLKAGGAYVPLDPAYPDERLGLMLEDADPPLVVARGPVLDRLAGLPAAHGRRLLDLDREAGAVAAQAAEDLEEAALPGGLAYVVYTSGSTGRPKGVAVPHRAVVRLVRGAGFARLAPDEVLLQLAPVAFDASTFEIWGALANGARLAVMPAGSPTLAGLEEVLGRFGVTTLWLTAGLFHQMVDERPAAFARVRQLLAGGDVLSPPRVRRLLEAVPGCTLINGYGPTENTTFTCCHPLRESGEVASPVPIGRPISGTRVYVLDAAFRPIPIGVPGELCAGGSGLARGYAGAPAATAERFVPDAVSGRPGERLYRTGDRVRFLADGRIEFLGRLDQQVKVRGFRVEPEEIETALAGHPAVLRAAVVAVPDPQGDKRLAAYVVPRGGVQVAKLREFLAERLPAYMVPALWTTLPELPLNAHGKVDRRALPDPVAAAVGRHRPPGTPAEEVLAGIWADVLGLERVGVDDDFFELGGHSLLATRIAARVREAFGVALPLAAVFDHATVAGLAPQIEALRAGLRRDAESAEEPPLVPAGRERPLPLSFAQERLWILDRFEPGTPNYNIHGSLRLRGDLDLAALRRALDTVVRRHEALRTTFEPAEGGAVQRIAPWLEVPLPVADLGGLEEAARRAAVEAWTREVAATCFDLARGPLLRLVLLRTAPREHVLLLAMHHIVSDGWSIGVLVRELTAAYATYVAAGREPDLPPLPVQYADFALWQRRRLSGERLERQVGYWRERIAGAPRGLELPADRPRPAIRTFRGGRSSLAMGDDLAARLRALARRQGATLFMTLLAALEVLLARLSGEEDVVVGLPIAGRNRAEVGGLIGMFLNTLVLRTGLAGDPCFAELVGRVREAALSAYAHQDLPFEKLLEELRPERDLSRTPLFQVFFNMLNFPVAALELPGLTVEVLNAPELPAKFDLTIYAAEEGAGLRFDFVYNADLFSETRMAEVACQYESLLAQAAEDPGRRIGALSLVTPAAAALLPDQRSPLGGEWYGAVHERFVAEARRAPERLAVADKDETWSYGDLEARTARLARRLRASGVGRGDVVAIYGHRSARLVWAILGALRAGAAFTVLDPAHPPARLADCVRLAGPRGWIEIAAAGPVPPALADSVAAVGCRCRVVLPRPQEEDAELGVDALGTIPIDPELGPDDLAYLAFTSGSTGVPKGILGRHGPLSHFIPWQRREFDLRASDRYSMLSGLSHDPLQRDIFTPLQLGAAICIPDPAEIPVPGRLAEWMAARGVTVAHLTPAMGQLLTELPPGASRLRLAALRWAFFVGDVLTRRDVARLSELAPNVVCVNFYGSTETQRAVGYRRVEGAGERPAAGLARENLPLGRGMEDVQLLVLNAAGEPAGVGELGEIHVRSPHLARGYLADPAGTAARFVPHSASPVASERLYRTGDLGRYLPAGDVEFWGRADFQVKIRGFRIEPGEIEAVLAGHPGVRECLVMARDGAGGEKRLVAYTLPAGQGAGATELRAYLKERLPEAMVPAAFVALERWPLNPNGKVDRRALPEPTDDLPQAEAFTAPRTETERTIAVVLQDILQRDELGVHDNFFELGGNSLLLVRAHVRLRELLGNGLQVVDLFTHPTVASLAEYLSRSEAAPSAARHSEERFDKVEAGQNRLRQKLRQRQQRSG